MIAHPFLKNQAPFRWFHWKLLLTLKSLGQKPKDEDMDQKKPNYNSQRTWESCNPICHLPLCGLGVAYGALGYLCETVTLGWGVETLAIYVLLPFLFSLSVSCFFLSISLFLFYFSFLLSFLKESVYESLSLCEHWAGLWCLGLNHIARAV